MHPYLRLHLLVEPQSQEGQDRSGGPPIPSPLLRRVFGKALVDRFCAFGKPLCEEKPPGAPRLPSPQELCPLAEACPYGVLFASSLSPRPPFALYVPPAGEDGDVRIEVTLYGPAWRLYPWAVAALEQALRRGLGRQRQPWTVREVRRVAPDRRTEPLAGAASAAVPPDLVPGLVGLGVEPFLGVQPVTVDLLSPARLLRDGRLLPGAEPVPFALLVARILDRFAGLYGNLSCPL